MPADIVHVTEESFPSEVLASDVPVIVDFWAEWCGPCKMLAPIFEDLAGEYSGRLKFAKLDVDAAPSVAGEMGVMSIPTMLIFKNGQPVSRIVGLQGKDALQKQIEEHAA